MKRLILGGLSSLILLTSATVGSFARADTTAINSTTLRNHSTKVSYLQPFNLVSLAYQGYLNEQGIPSGNSLILENQLGRITVTDLVKAAVNANKLPAEVVSDRSYLKAVEVQLASLQRSYYTE